MNLQSINMRGILINVVLLLSIGSSGPKAFAQADISINDIAKIHLVDGAAYLMGYYRNDYEILSENGYWKSYQTHEEFNRPNFKKNNNGKFFWDSRDSTEHALIKTVEEDSIKLFLETLRTIKPKFIPADFKINIPQLTRQIDTAYLKHLDQKRQHIFNSFFDTPEKLNHLLNTMQNDGWTDDYPYCVIEIIKKGGDTIKVITGRQVDYMLPWRINNIPTYDVNINAFFISAVALKGHRMSGKYLGSHLYSAVDFLYAQDAFERLRWQESSPGNLRYIQQHFDILSAANGIGYKFHPKRLNHHVIISGSLVITNKTQLVSLTRFAEDTVRRLLKTSGFMIDSCVAKPGCTINFFNGYGQASHYYFSSSQKELDQYLEHYKKNELLPFTIKAGERIEDNWIALPDGKFLLTAYLDDYAVGVPSGLLPKDGLKGRKFVFLLFTRDGNLISHD